MPIRRPPGWLLLPLVVLFAAGCGVPSSDGPEDVPSDLAAIGPSPGASSASPAVTATAHVGVTWIHGQRLTVIGRRVVASGRSERVNAALAALVGGPTRAERKAGLTTRVPPDAVLLAEISGRRAIVNLDLGSAPVSQSLAVGQVALTALSVRGVHSVVFTVAGSAVPVPLPGGKESRGPVTARDYRSVVKR